MVPRDEETETAVSKEEVQTQLWNHKVTKVTHPRAEERLAVIIGEIILNVPSCPASGVFTAGSKHLNLMSKSCL